MLKKTDPEQLKLIDDALLHMGHKKYKASMSYARAIFNFAKRSDIIATFRRDFDDFINVWERMPILRKFMQCPAIDRSIRKEKVKRFFGERIHGGVLHFIEKLIDNNQADLLCGIYCAFCEIVDEIDKKRKIRVITAFPINNSQLRRIQEMLEDFLKKEVIIRNDIDPEILGGFICYTDSIKIDMSIKKDLDKLKSQILSVPCREDKRDEC